MDVEVIASLVGSLGFPIFCCIMLFKQNEELRKSIDALKDVLMELKGRLTKENETNGEN